MRPLCSVGGAPKIRGRGTGALTERLPLELIEVRLKARPNKNVIGGKIKDFRITRQGANKCCLLHVEQRHAARCMLGGMLGRCFM